MRAELAAPWAPPLELRPLGSEFAPGEGGRRRGSVTAGLRALGRLVAVSAASRGPQASRHAEQR